MTEQSIHTAYEHQSDNESVDRVARASLVDLSQSVNELNTNPELIDAALGLVHEFGIKESFFDDPSRVIILAGAAARLHESSEKDTVSVAAHVADIIALVAHKHSDALAEVSEQLQDEADEFDEKTRLAVYDRYTDRALSQEIRSMMEAGSIPQVEDAKNRMGITPENEDIFEVRVLSIADENDVMGISAPRVDDDLRYSDPEYRAQQGLVSDVAAWKAELQERSKLFAKELGRDGAFAPAWVTEVDDVTTLCISMALAEKISNPETTAHSFYTEDDLKRSVAVLAHEYTHTQGGVNVDNDVTFGINVEELRAEHFSGDMHGYHDIKRFFTHYGIITGHSIKDGFDTRIKGGTGADVFGDIANRIGLARMVDVALASPKNYIEGQSNTFIKEAYATIGGFDGVLESLYKDEVAAGRERDVEARVLRAAEKMTEFERRSPGIIDSVEAMNSRIGLLFMTGKIVARAREAISLRKDLHYL